MSRSRGWRQPRPGSTSPTQGSTHPQRGWSARKRWREGHRVQPGQALMALVPLDDLWVVANFTETQLTNVRVGQPVRIKADVYPGYMYNGKQGRLIEMTVAKSEGLGEEALRRLPVSMWDGTALGGKGCYLKRSRNRRSTISPIPSSSSANFRSISRASCVSVVPPPPLPPRRDWTIFTSSRASMA